MSVINTNTLSLVTQNNLTKSQGALNSAIERLSSGMRINSAKDDAAGQAIANRFTANIKGLTQAQRNANDGISLTQTTEGALNEVNTNLQRIRELTVQSANGSNSADDRTSMQAEITQRLNEIDRTSKETNFNGVKVLADGVVKLDIQVGAKDGETISIDLTAINRNALNLTGFSVRSGINATGVGVAATAASFVRTGADVALSSTGYTAPAGGSFGAFSTKGGDYFVAVTGSTAPADNGTYKLTVATNGTTTLGAKETTPPTGTTPATSIKAGVLLTGAELTAGKVFAYSGTETGAPAYVIKDTVDGKDAYFTAKIAADGKVTRGEELASTIATTNPLETLDKALAQVDKLRGSLGAVQNRFDSVIANLGTTIVNLSSSRSRIEDADYATEVSNMTRAQILQQAGTSVLAKANQSTEGVMSLLR